MNIQRQIDEAALRQLFNKFVVTGLTGQWDEFVSILDDPYTGVGLGEQGMVNSAAQVEEIMRASYKPKNDDEIKIEITELLFNFMHDDVAILSGTIEVTTIPKNKESLCSGLVQTIGAKRKGDTWVICFTHASVAMLTKETLEAYPIKFMDHTLSRLKAELHPDVALYAEVNLTNNSLVQLEGHLIKINKDNMPKTLEDVAKCGLFGELDGMDIMEYNSFFDRLRLIGLFAENVRDDQLSYCLNIQKQPVWIQVTINMMRHPYSGDISVVIIYTKKTDYKNELEQLSHKAFHDALTGVLNREGFDKKSAEMLDTLGSKDSMALYIIDLDDFKQVNDRLGHQVGDTMLRQVAGVLQDTFNDIGGVVGRIGGDEFMIMLTGVFTLQLVEQRAMELLNAMKLHMGTNKLISVSISIGIAYGLARATFEKFYRTADIALYTAKKAGKCRFHLVNADTNFEYTNTTNDSNLLSLQTLLNSTRDRDVIQNISPYEALVENITGGVLMISLSDKVKLSYCNDWVNRTFGYENAELDKLQKDDPFILVHPDDVINMQKAVEQMRTAQEKINVCYRFLAKNGVYHNLKLCVSMTERNKDEIIYYGIISNVDETV